MKPTSKENRITAPTKCLCWMKLNLQMLLALLFFLSPFSEGFVTQHRYQKDPSVRLQTSVLQTTKSSTSESTRDSTVSDPKKKIPIHLLAGFLGSGKTTTLKHVLENKEDVKVGVIVNDVASVNIDAKLISRRDSADNSDTVVEEGEGVVELQNGCACCSLAGELFDSIEILLKPRTETGATANFDAILVELSGVADPLAIQNNWKNAEIQESNTFVTESSELGKVVTLVDATTFGSDYMTFDILKDRDGWFEDNAGSESDGEQIHKHTLNRQVVELLTEQVEAADLIVVNKEDLAGDEKTEITKTMAKYLNEDARVVVTSHGKIQATELLGLANSPIPDREGKHDESDIDSSHSHNHDHIEEPSDSHSHSHDHTACEDPKCTDPSHDHSHSHDHAKCEDVECTDPSHDHSNSHDHSVCDDPKCTDPSHDHSHSHDHGACNDPDCTDPSHSHSHSHDHDQSATSTSNLGISNFVYKATRPFQPKRLQKLLFEWPIPIKEELDFDLLNDAAKTGYGIDDEEQTKKCPFVGVLRSKGFCWIAPTAWDGLLADPWRHDTAMYWSHAGKHFGLQAGGNFWDSLPRSTMEEFFASSPEMITKILEEDFVTEEFGDRRQELVFIGVGLCQQDIEKALDDCLLTDTEMEDYRAQLALVIDAS